MKGNEAEWEEGSEGTDLGEERDEVTMSKEHY